MLLDIFRLFATKGGLSKNTKLSIYKNGFYLGAGIFAGIALDNMWQLLDMPGTDKPVTRAGDMGQTTLTGAKKDQVYQSVIITAILMGSILTGKYANEVIPTAIGAYIGSNWSNTAERNGGHISVIPFD